MADFDPKELASRVQGLLQARFKGDLLSAAGALEVEAEELRRIVEDEAENPRLDVLSALVRFFGVDPCWLVTGEYDWRAHLRTLEAEDEDPSTDSKPLLLRLTTPRGDDIRRPIPPIDMERLWRSSGQEDRSAPPRRSAG